MYEDQQEISLQDYIEASEASCDFTRKAALLQSWLHENACSLPTTQPC